MNVLLKCALVAALKDALATDSTCDQNAADGSSERSDDIVLQIDKEAPSRVLMQTGRSLMTKLETGDQEQTDHDDNQTGRVLLQSGRSGVTKLQPSHEDRTGQDNQTGRVLLQFNRSGLIKSNSSQEDELWSADSLFGNFSQRLDNFSRDIARMLTLASDSLNSFVKEAYLNQSMNVSSLASSSLISMPSVVRNVGVLSNETITACRVQLGALMSILSEPVRPGSRLTSLMLILILLIVLFCLLSILVYRRKHHGRGIYGEEDAWKHESWLRDRQAFNSEPASLQAGEGGGSFSFSRDPLGRGESYFRQPPPQDHGQTRRVAYHRDAWNSPASRESTASSIDSSASKMYQQQQQGYRSGAVRSEMFNNVDATVTRVQGQAYTAVVSGGSQAYGQVTAVAGGVGTVAAAGAQQVSGTAAGQATGKALSNLAQAVDSKAERLKARWEEARAAHL